MNPRGKITLVFFFLAVCATAVLVHSYDRMRAERVNPSELFDVVRQQLAACLCEDFPSAYRQASATVQSRWPLERFSSMLRNDYARVVKTDRVEFGACKREGNRALVEVFFIGRDGVASPCLYTLVSEGEAWKIDSMRWVKARKSASQMRGIRS